MKYKGDKYIKAYTHFRTMQDDKISQLTIKINELERTLEWLIGKMLHDLEELKI